MGLNSWVLLIFDTGNYYRGVFILESIQFRTSYYNINVEGKMIYDHSSFIHVSYVVQRNYWNYIIAHEKISE